MTDSQQLTNAKALANKIVSDDKVTNTELQNAVKAYSAAPEVINQSKAMLANGKTEVGQEYARINDLMKDVSPDSKYGQELAKAKASVEQHALSEAALNQLNTDIKPEINKHISAQIKQALDHHNSLRSSVDTTNELKKLEDGLAPKGFFGGRDKESLTALINIGHKEPFERMAALGVKIDMKNFATLSADDVITAIDNRVKELGGNVTEYNAFNAATTNQAIHKKVEGATTAVVSSASSKDNEARKNEYDDGKDKQFEGIEEIGKIVDKARAALKNYESVEGKPAATQAKQATRSH